MVDVRDPVKRVYNRWERFLNTVSAKIGGDRELDELSRKLDRLKQQAYEKGTLTAGDRERIFAEMELVIEAYREIAKARGYPPGNVLPATKESFRIYEAEQKIHFLTFAGDDLRSGEVGRMIAKLLDGGTVRDVKDSTKTLAFDLVASASPEIAIDKIRLLRSELARVPDRALQRSILSAVGQALDQELKGWVVGGGRPPPISRAAFDAAVTFESVVAMHETPLPDAVRGTNKLFPNAPIAGWAEVVERATAASLDDLSRAKKLFLDTVPAGVPKTVAMKIDLNLGADGPPSVTDPACTYATIKQLLSRADAGGKRIAIVVGDSSGGENIPIGRTTMDIMRDTGNYHFALKAGLEVAVAHGDEGAKASLALIQAREAEGVYFASKNDTKSTAADLAAAEASAKKYVRAVDFDAEGYREVDPGLGPLGLAAWGEADFAMAKPWVDADYRVHVTRGVSNHLLAGWTGATKGLIGLHGFGLRPMDQGADKMGTNIVDTLGILTGGAGFLAILGHRTGLPDIAKRLLGLGDDALRGKMDALDRDWQNLKRDPRAWKIYADKTAALKQELDADRRAGKSEVEVSSKMRTRMRAILDEADGVAPGFRRDLWDMMHAATRIALPALFPIRDLIPATIRDESMGGRIGLLSSLPYPSDLVIQAQAKIGEGGGPDAYTHVRDVGVIIAGTDEMSCDAIAWRRAGREDNIWSSNRPVADAIRYREGPMAYDEIRELSQSR
jgi:hypothetical protein